MYIPVAKINDINFKFISLLILHINSKIRINCQHATNIRIFYVKSCLMAKNLLIADNSNMLETF